MTPDILRQAGEAIYGERWQSALARDLSVSDRTVRRWLAGDAQIPPIGDELRELLRPCLDRAQAAVEVIQRALDALP